MQWATQSWSPTLVPSSSTEAIRRELRHFTEKPWPRIQTFWLQKTGGETTLAFHPIPCNISRLENLAASLLPRWHFPMLNDVDRNRSYEAGIEAAIREGGGKTVLDLGAGTGLLSLMAARAGAERVYACEASEVKPADIEDISSRQELFRF